MKVSKALVAAAFAGLIATLTGCGTIGNAVVSDQELARKAAFALDTTADQVTVSERFGEVVGNINFVATTKGRKHQCYITSVYGVANSAAICSGASSVKTSSSCNALTKSAGQCH